ncbi:D-alanyl-D-alanine carboxypeptidase (penicillin-binding protein 5/6) [Thiothrix caldifontis]|jgi:D-alanyl-D-alanine carboxypeptidase|uniref:serine-type D-Ala-D-Ala carboxypeptidase n=1 Tax=Thiothrix caldifontis TaxID=525918 RepID=A0A1H3VFR5_9GAMM|nr:D-alanyl-D-alanine carboxypeptidase family protein [Thiothrix caldifontis]SDZ73074.1 D-alanyl-D-alanine carboxypeptidase (penicillin-binding protein 5/6) [Thiothrix caldifontis]
MFTRILKLLLLAGLLAGGIASAEPTSVPSDTGEPAPQDMSTAPYNDPNIPPEIIAMAPGVPEIEAKSYLLVDFQSGEELAGINPGMRVEPASITKLMTAYLVYQELGKGTVKLEDEVLISEKAWKMEGSRMFVELGKKIQFEKLLKGMIIQSGNDAAMALAEHVAGSEETFVQRMNQTAAELGMTDTRYMNVTGWPAKDHYTTARDIVKLVEALVHEFPEYYKLYAIKEFSYNNIKQQNRNRLLWRDPTVDGLKTGHTESAGYCLVASAKRDNMRLISVVLGAKSEEARANVSQQLLEYGFRTFETHKLYDAGAVLAKVRVWKGEATEVPAGVVDNLFVSIVKGRYDQLKGGMQLDKGIDAPIKRGDVLGKVIITDQELGKVVKETPLLALEDVTEGGWWRRTMDSIQKLFAD